MVVVVAILLAFIFCTIALYIGLMNLSSYIMMIVLMIIFYILRIYNDAKFRNSNREKKLRKIFKDWKEEENLTTYIFNKYIYIIKSQSYNCLNEIKDKVTPEIFEIMEKDCNVLKNIHHKNILSGFELIDLELTVLDKYYVEFIITYKCFDYTINRKDKIIRGNDKEKREYSYKIGFEKDEHRNMVLSYNEIIYQK
jgi:hypothetical protein